MANIIDTDVLNNVNITDFTVVLTYAHPLTAKSALVLPRVELYRIAGGGSYRVQAKVLGGEVTPVSVISVPAGQVSAILQGRHLAIKPGEVVTIVVRGLTADVDVDTTTSLFDATPIRQDEFDEIIDDIRSATGGGGSVEVDHNYGGKDRYAYWETPSGPGIGDATVLAYLAEDYNAGKRGDQFTRGTATTDSAGRWRRPIMLDPGDYVLFYYKTGAFGPDTANLAVV